MGVMYGRTTRQDPEYPGILGIADTVSVWGLCMGARTTREDPEYMHPGILSNPDTVSVKGYMYMYAWGDNTRGSRVSQDI